MTTLTRVQKSARIQYYRRYRAAGHAALVAWMTSFRDVIFDQQMRDDVRDYKKRSRAAKRGWQRRLHEVAA